MRSQQHGAAAEAEQCHGQEQQPARPAAARLPGYLDRI
jgi:hypothetical protein